MLIHLNNRLLYVACVELSPLDESSEGWMIKSLLWMLYQINLSLQNFDPPIFSNAGKEAKYKTF